MKTHGMHQGILLFSAIAMFLISSGFTNKGPDQGIEIVFVDHLTAGLIEQDVFVEKVPGSGMVYRILPGERSKYINAPVYKSEETQKHDPFNARNAGPYRKGEALNMTLGEWLQGRGTATYQCDDGWGVFEANFENLVPHGIYTMWHFFMAKESTDPFLGTLDVPMGDRDGAHSVFQADENGKAKLDIRFNRCLQMSNTQLASGVAIAYHSDGKTYGVLPGDFGTVTHVQAFALLPDVEKPAKADY